MNYLVKTTLLVVVLLIALNGSSQILAQTSTGNATDSRTIDSEEKDAELKTLHDKFQQNLSNTKFVGQFTITGMENEKPREEEYTITKVKKLPKADMWEITARIKYGDHDVTVPMAMLVKWAGKTPVITVDQMFVPGLGTFDARVLLRKDKYAGTWAHGKVGGHLFGRIEKISDTASEKKEKTHKAKR